MRWRKILGGVALVLVLALLWIWLVARSRSQERADELEALIARLAQDHRPATLEEALERVDPEVLTRFGAFAKWAEKPWPKPRDSSCLRPDRWVPFHLGDDPEPPIHGFEVHEGARAHAEALGALLDQGALPLREDVHLAFERRRLGHVPSLEERYDTYNIWAVLGAADWMAIEAMIGTERERSFHRIDALAASFGHPFSLMDNAVGSAVAYLRDASYVRDALEFGAGSPRFDRWLAESPPSFERLADAFRGHCLTYTIPQARAVVKSGGSYARELHPFWGADDPLEWLDHESYYLWDASREAVRCVRVIARAEDWLRGRLQDGPLEQAASWVDRDDGLLFGAVATWTMQTRLLIQARAFHRATRLLVRVLRFQADGRLPEDDAALREELGERAAHALLEASPRDIVLRYEQPGLDSVRVAGSQDRPPPRVLWGADEPTWFCGSRLGQPGPDPRTPVWFGGCGVEARLPPK